jgi:hypothetical protein
MYLLYIPSPSSLLQADFYTSLAHPPIDYLSVLHTHRRSILPSKPTAPLRIHPCSDTDRRMWIQEEEQEGRRE